jgi:hypothetical protein
MAARSPPGQNRSVGPGATRPATTPPGEADPDLFEIGRDLDGPPPR